MNLDRSIKKYKIQYVVRSFEQCFGRNYKDTWASVIKSNSYKVLMAKTATKNLELKQMDVVLSYPNRPLDKDKTIFVELTIGYLTNSENCVQVLNSDLYGLKLEARVYYLTLYTTLLKFGVRQTFFDQSLSVHSNKIIIVIFVDDLFIAATASRISTSQKKANVSV